MKKLIVTVTFLMIIAGLVYAGSKDPVAVLFQVKGNVEYTKDGSNWKKVRRNKFLFSGYQVRSNESGSGVITNRISGENSRLPPNSIIVVTDSGVELKDGSLLDSDQPNALISGLMKRFSRSQTYTTVRRSAGNGSDSFDIARHMVLSDGYPYLVWENLNQAYRYELSIGSDLYRIGPTNDAMIRVAVKPFTDTQTVHIKAYKGDQEVLALEPYKSRGEMHEHTVRWMSPEEEQQFNESVHTIVSSYPDNAFMLGSFFEREEMWTAAMDQYKAYLSENPEEIEMTPYLFRVYKKLKLQKMYNDELNAWRQAMKE